LTGTDAIKTEVAWQTETIYDGRNVEFEVRDALWRYSNRAGKRDVEEI